MSKFYFTCGLILKGQIRRWDKVETHNKSGDVMKYFRPQFNWQQFYLLFALDAILLSSQ